MHRCCFLTALLTLLVATALLTPTTARLAPGDQSPMSITARAEPPGLLISRQLAESLKLSVNDQISLSSHPSGTKPRSFRVAGIYEPMPDPMRLGSERLEARLHLPDLLELAADPAEPLSAESVTAINVALKDHADVSAFARDLSAKVPGVIVRPTAHGEQEASVFVVLERFHLAIALVTVVASTVFLLALMVMLVEERRKTVGILRIIGLRRGRILAQVFAEGLLIAAAGALFGILLAAASEDLINRFFQWRYDTSLLFVHITPQVAWRSLLIAVPLGILASVVASWTLLRRDPLSLAGR